MTFLLNVVAGFAGGVLGGMGMGGGTVLIPLLTLFCGISQHTAQAVNLVSFIPMAIVALIIHFKNNLVNFVHITSIILSGVITCIVGCYVARAMNGELLKRFFGGFLVLLSAWQVVSFIRKRI
jgi:uncharacterized membrane protein YfcA